MNKKSCEINFDGLIGPTHNYSGLSFGNIASMGSKEAISNPQAAALQGLEKMKILAQLGIPQGILPPHERPYVPILRSLGFHGRDHEILQCVAKEAPYLLSACSSAAAMWAANAATISPSADTLDKHVHITPANLCSKFHRSFEPATTKRIFQAIFSDSNFFKVHDPLPASEFFADEGAANHIRLCSNHSTRGVELFVFGRSASQNSSINPKQFPARQTEEASQAIARLHRLPPDNIIFVLQNPQAIDLGVFHNDVISVGNENLFFYHELAFCKTDELIDTIRSKIDDMIFLKVFDHQVSLNEAVRTYLFNSQIVTLPSGFMALIAPTECQESSNVSTYLNDLLQQSDHPIKQVIYVNLKESMQNGGGPACLRLRIALNSNEYAAINPNVLLTDQLYKTLKEWILRHYRDRLSPSDLADPLLLEESCRALDELTKILQLGNIYAFQNNH